MGGTGFSLWFIVCYTKNVSNFYLQVRLRAPVKKANAETYISAE